MPHDLSVDQTVAILATLVEDRRAALAANTLNAIRYEFGIPVTERPENRRVGLCAVDGSYFHTPPRIVIARSESPRRRAFTALHELGHHLIRNSWEFFGLTSDRRLEEGICDSFAAEILLPNDLSGAVLCVGTPTAQQFLELYDRSKASRTVCARRVAASLNCVGHAVVARGTVATYCASARTPFRSEYGVDQGEDSIFAAALRDGASSGLTRLWYAPRVVSPVFRADAVAADGHVFAVFSDPEPSQ